MPASISSQHVESDFSPKGLEATVAGLLGIEARWCSEFQLSVEVVYGVAVT